MSDVTPVGERTPLRIEVRRAVRSAAPYDGDTVTDAVIEALLLAGWAFVRTNGVIEPGEYDADTSADGYYLTTTADRSPG